MTHAELLKRLQHVKDWLYMSAHTDVVREMDELILSVATLIEQHGKMMEFIEGLADADSEFNEDLLPDIKQWSIKLLEELEKC